MLVNPVTVRMATKGQTFMRDVLKGAHIVFNYGNLTKKFCEHVGVEPTKENKDIAWVYIVAYTHGSSDVASYEFAKSQGIS